MSRWFLSYNSQDVALVETLHSALQRKDPGARVILVSGWSPSDQTGQSGALTILPKPVGLERLNAALQSVAETMPAPAAATIS